MFIVFALGVVFARIFLIRKDNLVRDIKCFLALALTTLYIILLSAFVAYAYVWRTDAFLPVLFYGTFMLMMFVCELAERVSFSGVVLVLIAAVSVAGTVYFSDTYKEMNYVNLPYENCVSFADDIIAQFKEAEIRKDKEINLVLPAFDTDDNWPIADYGGGYFTHAMYDHKVIGSYIEVKEMIFTKEKNEEFGIK